MLEVDVKRRVGELAIEAAFSVPPGEVTALFGRSGSGKTSVIHMIAGLTRPDSGRISLDGDLLFDSKKGVDLAPERRRLGCVFQDARLFPHLTVEGNLAYGFRLRERNSDPGKFTQIVELLGLTPLLRRRPGRLSGGEQQRVAIGRALLSGPRVLLLDEPLASLDAEKKAEILPYLERLRDEIRLPIVFVSHIFDEVVRLAKNLLVMDFGRIRAAGLVTEIAHRIELGPLGGAEEAGAVIDAKVQGHDPTFGLSELAFAGGVLHLPRLNLPQGENIRVHIRARDVSIALAKPAEISVLNILPARILEMATVPAQDAVDLVLDAGTEAGVKIRARISRKSAHDLRLTPGLSVYALIKTLSFDRVPGASVPDAKPAQDAASAA